MVLKASHSPVKAAAKSAAKHLAHAVEDWDPLEHPRNEDGEFVKKGTGTTAKKAPKPKTKPIVKGHKPTYKPPPWNKIHGASVKLYGKKLYERKAKGEFSNDHELYLAAAKYANAYKKNHPHIKDKPTANQVYNAALRTEIDQTGSLKMLPQLVIGGLPSKAKPTKNIHHKTSSGVKLTSKFLAPGQLKDTGKKLSGVNGAKIYEDSNGTKWIVKFPGGSKGTSQAYSNSKFLADLDVATGRIMNKAGLPTPAIYKKKVDGKEASVQKMYSRAKPAFPNKTVDINQLSSDDRLMLQENQVVDWLISNHDTHTAQFIRTDKGIVGIDKGQAFKFFGNDKLSPDYVPVSPLEGNKPVYQALWHQFADGKGELFNPDGSGGPESAALHSEIQRIQEIPDDEIRDLLRPYAVEAAKQGKLSLPGSSGMSYTNKVDKFLNMVVARKAQLQSDFQKLYDEQLKKREQKLGINKPKPKPTKPNMQLGDSAKEKLSYAKAYHDGLMTSSQLADIVSQPSTGILPGDIDAWEKAGYVTPTVALDLYDALPKVGEDINTLNNGEFTVGEPVNWLQAKSGMKVKWFGTSMTLSGSPHNFQNTPHMVFDATDKDGDEFEIPEADFNNGNVVYSIDNLINTQETLSTPTKELPSVPMVVGTPGTTVKWDDASPGTKIDFDGEEYTLADKFEGYFTGNKLVKALDYSGHEAVFDKSDFDSGKIKYAAGQKPKAPTGVPLAWSSADPGTEITWNGDSYFLGKKNGKTVVAVGYKGEVADIPESAFDNGEVKYISGGSPSGIISVQDANHVSKEQAPGKTLSPSSLKPGDAVYIPDALFSSGAEDSGDWVDSLQPKPGASGKMPSVAKDQAIGHVKHKYPDGGVAIKWPGNSDWWDFGPNENFFNKVTPSTKTGLDEFFDSNFGNTSGTVDFSQIHAPGEIKDINELTPGDEVDVLQSTLDGDIWTPSVVDSVVGGVAKVTTMDGSNMQLKADALEGIMWHDPDNTEHYKQFMKSMGMSVLGEKPPAKKLPAKKAVKAVKKPVTVGNTTIEPVTSYKQVSTGDSVSLDGFEGTVTHVSDGLSQKLIQVKLKNGKDSVVSQKDLDSGAANLTKFTTVGSTSAPDAQKTVPPGYLIKINPSDHSTYVIQKPNGSLSENKSGVTKTWPSYADALQSTTMAKYAKNAQQEFQQAKSSAATEVSNAPDVDMDAVVTGTWKSKYPNMTLAELEQYANLKQILGSGQFDPTQYAEFKALKQKVMESKKAIGAAIVVDEPIGVLPVVSEPASAVSKKKLGGMSWKKKGAAPPGWDKIKGPDVKKYGEQLYAAKKAGAFFDVNELYKAAAKISAAQKKQAAKEHPGKQLKSGVDYATANALRNAALRVEWEDTGTVDWESDESKLSSTVKGSVKATKAINLAHKHVPIKTDIINPSQASATWPDGVIKDASKPAGSYENPHWFNSTSQMNKYARPYTKTTGWNHGQHSAFKDFTGSGSGYLNPFVRSGYIQPNGYYSKSKLEQMRDNMDAAFNSSNVKGLPDWTIVTRGTSGGWEFGIPTATPTFEQLKAQEGKVLQNKSYASTAMYTSGFGGPIKVIYKLPPGFRGIFCGNSSQMTWHTSENEYILPRNTQYRIESVTKKDGKTQIVVEVTGVVPTGNK